MIPIAAIPVSFGEIVSLTRKLAFDNLFGESDVATFENQLAGYVGSESAVSCDSGRTALYLALKALGLEAGDEVLVPAYTCAIVFEMVLRAGLRPVFVDVNPETCTIDPELVPKSLSSRTKVVIPVHLFGTPCDMDPIVEVADKYGLYVIEDVAQGLGAEFKGRKTGSFGDLAIFSFGPGKSITGGEGGAITINNTELTETVETLQSHLPEPDLGSKLHVTRNVLAMKMFSSSRFYGLVKNSVDSSIRRTDDMINQNCLTLMEESPSHLMPSLKPTKMPEASATVIVKQLHRIDDLNAKRIANVSRLSELMRGEDDQSIKLPRIDSEMRSTFTRFPVVIIKGTRSSIIKQMLRQGVDAKELYHYVAWLLHSLSKSSYPQAEFLSDSLMAIPNHPLLTNEELEKISSVFLAALKAI
jgi:dTDP-4-amino-4,6-dideoxygalactose transaminase